jgi:spermidine synthase
MRRSSFLVLFAVSGAAALIYEVVWTRLLTLHLGHGLAAASAVLAAFMGGLAAGAGAAGRIAGRLERAKALRLYAALELAIGVLAMLMPLFLTGLRPLLASAYADGSGGAAFAVLRLVTSVLLLTLPAACMGATFPIASKWMVRHASLAAQDAGALYASNTLGAAAGAIVAGFFLVPALGLSGSTAVGVALNVVAAAGAFWIAQNPSEAGHRAPVSNPGKAGPYVPERNPWLAAAALGASGFASLTLQVVWTRLLAQILGPTTYAFSMVVAIFIIGIAGGAAIAARLVSRVTPSTGLASTLLLSSALALAAAASVDWALMTIAELVARPEIQFADVLQREVLLATTLLLPMTLAFGAAFPFAVALATGAGMTADSRGESFTEHIGLIYAVNTLGAILGSLVAGFLLVPRIGLHGSIRLVAALGVVSAILVVMGATAAPAKATAPRRARGRIAAFALALAVAVAIAIVPEWNRALLSSGAYKYAPATRGVPLESALTAGTLLSYQEGSTATVSVRKLAGTTSLAIDGKVDASNAGDMLTQRLLAHVPLLLHPNPRRAAVLGLGSGVTLGSALRHPLENATVIEISREVVEASRYFETENHSALTDSRTRVIVGDGRTHLMLGNETFDMIVSEPSNPWMAGIASLFTREFFESARGRLNPGGVLCQWAHTYDISSDDLKSIVATFLSVFPNGTLWLIGDADVLLVGSTEPLDSRIAGIGEAMQRRHSGPSVAEDLAEVGVTGPFAVVSMFVAEGEALKAWANGAPLQTDDRSRLEFSGPRSIFGTARDDNAADLRALAATSPRPAAVSAAFANATSDDWRDRGLMYLKADASRPAYDDLLKALETNPDDPVALDAFVRAAANLNRIGDAHAFISRLASNPARVPAKLTLSKVLASQGNVDEAVRIPFTLLQENPSNVPALEQFASVLSDVGDTARLEPVVARLLQVAPKNSWSHYYAASLFFLQNRHDMALRAARNAVSIDPANAKAHNLVGAALASLGQSDAARTAFETSIKADPREPGTYTNLATLELHAGNRDLAARYFAEALTVDPTSQPARDGLASIK